MGKWLNKEFTIKMKLWAIILDVVLGSVIFTIASYYFMKTGSDATIKLLTWINTEHLESSFALKMFPVILIITAIIELSLFAVGNTKTSDNTKSKKEDK